jgi:hypothetical protein
MSLRQEYYRLKAAQCERAGAEATEPGVRQTFADLAKQWRQMADSLEHIERLWDGAGVSVPVVDRAPRGISN